MSKARRINDEDEEWNETHEDYISMPIHLFRHFENLGSDVFIKINLEGETKFIKRIPAYESFSKKLFDEYFSKGVKELYFHKSYKITFSKLLFNNLVSRLEEDGNDADYSTRQDEVFVSLKDLIQNLGIKKPIIDVCEAAIESIEKEMNQYTGPWKSALNELLKSGEQSYHLRFVRLTCLFVTLYFESKDWPNRETLAKKLYYASFFCDLNLDEKCLLEIRCSEELEKLSGFEQRKVLLHAKKNAEVVRNYPAMSEDVFQLILLHHGSKNGIGFNGETTERYPELVKIFMICQELATEVLADHNSSLEKIILKLQKKYYETQFEKVLDNFLHFSKKDIYEKT